MTREQLKKQTIIILNREDITIEEMTENILQLVDIAIDKELRLYGVVKSLKGKYTNELWFWLERFNSEDNSNRLWWYKKT